MTIPARMCRLAAMLALFALGACATGSRLSDEEKLALYEAHAGAPVDSIRDSGSVNGWTPLGDSAIAIWTRPSEAWLLDLYGPCSDIEYTPVILLTNQTGRIHARFDKVIAHDRSAIQIPCTIRQIRPLDVKAVRAAEKQAREAATPAPAN